MLGRTVQRGPQDLGDDATMAREMATEMSPKSFTVLLVRILLDRASVSGGEKPKAAAVGV